MTHITLFVRYNKRYKLWEFPYVSPYFGIDYKEPSRTRTKVIALIYANQRAEILRKAYKIPVWIEVYKRDGLKQMRIVK